LEITVYRLSPPKVTGFQSRLRIVGTAVGLSLIASTLLWLGTFALSTPVLTEAHPVQITQSTPPLVSGKVSVQEAWVEPDVVTDLPVAASSGTGPLVARRTVVHPIQSGENFGGLMTRYGVVNPSQVLAATQAHFNMAHVKAGKNIAFEFLGETLTQLIYEIDEDRTLRVDFSEDQVIAHIHEMKWTPSLARKELVLTSSLWAAAINAGFKPADIVTLAQIFEYDIDFGSELQSGARFTIVMDELHREDGARSKPGTFHAVRLVNGSREYTAIRHESKKGTVGWYHPDGKATARPFLRSPLEFTRVTSRFGVNRKTHYHGGVDMGARTGTPIRAAGDGVVVIAGRRGAYGKHIKLSHARYGQYHTSYSHLSKLKVKNGQRVKQGQIIGLVGSTGRSTGPHLHYEFHVRGKRVNPMKVKLPGSKSLPKHELSRYKSVVAKWLPKLDGLDPSTALVEAE
jgi:murein DD-endopeptidase MepM/ murein hydrolase activator NlpD